ncbi:MAG: PASTA domain-containing protein, partial [Solirubrobacteraceae bacterium]
RRRSPWVPWAWALLVALLLAGGGVAAYLAIQANKTKQIIVPTVTGDQVNTARTVLQGDGFAVAVINVPNPRPAGIVIGEAPNAGSKADKGSTVTLTVSRGPANVPVPSVEGLSAAAATRRLHRTGLKVGNVIRRSSTQFPTGQVIGTNPGVATTVAPGTLVTLIVSSGQPLKTVPNVTGETQAAATSDLTKAGFQVNQKTQPSSSATVGNVTSQTPAGNATAPQGSTVTITVASAPSTTNVPGVTGDTAAAAVGALTGAGFNVVQVTQNVSVASQDGTVIKQNPKANATAKKGSTVTITIGHYLAGTSTTTSTTTTSTPTTSSATSTTAPPATPAPAG